MGGISSRASAQKYPHREGGRNVRDGRHARTCRGCGYGRYNRRHAVMSCIDVSDKKILSSRAELASSARDASAIDGPLVFEVRCPTQARFGLDRASSVLPLIAAIILFAVSASAAPAERGVMVRVAQIYLSPDTSSQKMAQLERGREVAVMERSQQWAKVFASITPEQDITGWMLDKGIVTRNTANSDKIRCAEIPNYLKQERQRTDQKTAT